MRINIKLKAYNTLKTMEVMVNKIKKIITNTNLLFIMLLLCTTCQSMETNHQTIHTTSEKNNVDNQLIIGKLNVVKEQQTMLALPNGLKLSNHEIKLFHKNECIAHAQYISFNNIPKKLSLFVLLQKAIEWHVISLQLPKWVLSSQPILQRISQELTSCSSIAYIKILEVDASYRNKKLGQQIASFLFLQIMQENPTSVLLWMATPLDNPFDKNLQQRLYKFYRNLGATVLEDFGGFAWINTKKYLTSLQKFGFKTPQSKL